MFQNSHSYLKTRGTIKLYHNKCMFQNSHSYVKTRRTIRLYYNKCMFQNSHSYVKTHRSVKLYNNKYMFQNSHSYLKTRKTTIHRENQMHTAKLSHSCANPCSNPIYKIRPSIHKNKTYMHRHQTQLFEELLLLQFCAC